MDSTMDDEIEETPTWKGVPATMICINVYDQNGETAEVAHAATCRMIRQCLRICGSNYIGVCLYGTETNSSSNSVEEVFPLKLPTLEDYRKLQNIQIATQNKAQDLILSDLLWYCNKAFTSCKKQLSSRNILILSRLEVPSLKTDELHALKRVREIADTNIDIKVINIAKSEYQIHTFYKDLLSNAWNKVHLEDNDMPKPVWDKVEIERLMYQQSHRHLAVARITFEIAEELAIGVGVYTLLKSDTDIMKKTDLHRDTNKILTSVNKTIKVTVTDETEMDVDEVEKQPVPLLKSELLYYKIYGGEKVQFTDEEMKKMRNPFGPPMLKLLGFKPSTIMSKEKWFLKSCYFLYPNEGIVEGSVTAFKALFKACVETNMVAICVLCTRVNARPIIVALSPSTNPLGLDVDLGFDVIRVPFVEHVRQLPVLDEDEDIKVPEANKTVMRDILKKIQFEYKPDMFENPKKQKQYKVIEEKALEVDEEEPFIDTTKPDSSLFHDLQDILFQELFGPFGPVAVKKSASNKDGPVGKKPKQEIDEDLLQTRLESQKVNSYTVAQLKDILYSKNITDLPALTGLKKNELVELVYKHCK